MAAHFFRRRRDGTFTIRLSEEGRETFRTLAAQLIELVREGDPSDPAIRRLFPPAFVDDDAEAEAFDALTRTDLAAQRIAGAETVLATVDGKVLTEDDLAAWLAVANDLRLVLGARLAIAEDSGPEDFDGEDAETFVFYGFLSGLVSDAIEVTSGITQDDLAADLIARAQAERAGGAALD
jgi:hypothetical protein